MLNKNIILYLIILIMLFSFSCSIIHAEDSCAEFIRDNDGLKFEINRPVRGTYSESDNISLTINFNSPSHVSFSASELTYKEGQDNIEAGSYPLDVRYFVQFNNENKYSFGPNSTFTLPGTFVENSIQTFDFSGNVTIEHLTSQPAGKYKGTITVTVSPCG